MNGIVEPAYNDHAQSVQTTQTSKQHSEVRTYDGVTQYQLTVGNIVYIVTFYSLGTLSTMLVYLDNGSTIIHS